MFLVLQGKEQARAIENNGCDDFRHEDGRMHWIEQVGIISLIFSMDFL